MFSLLAVNHVDRLEIFLLDLTYSIQYIIPISSTTNHYANVDLP